MMKLKLLLIASLYLGSLLSIVYPSTASAISGSEFRPGNIMSDSVFFNANSLNSSQIQAFLESKVPSCDTWGEKPYGNTTRAQYAASRGVSTPFICLRDFRQDTPERLPESGLCNHLPQRSGRSAAQIIDDVSRACGVSQKVLIVLLQKEQGLITDDWPWPIQYRAATGYGCPDTAPCDSQYYGFFNQVYQAARVFKWYALNNGPNYRKNQNNYIRYNPDASCGGSSVYIENQATAGLYNYTPYQPNEATLSVSLGETAHCGAYGNKNFWWYYRLWFGSTHTVSLPECTEGGSYSLACVWRLRNVIGDKQYLLSSKQERDDLVNGGSYIFEGTYFFGNIASNKQAWNIPVYRLQKPNGDSFLTISETERSSLISNGYTDKGIDFYANPPSDTSNAGYAIYRMYSPSTHTHAWVTTLAQRSEYIKSGYSYEGIAFQSLSHKIQATPPPSGKHNLYRFYINATNSHFYTSSLTERDNLYSRNGFTYEGVSWFGNHTITSKPVYRLYSNSRGEHMFTTDVNEKNALINSKEWQSEGTSHFASPENNSRPVYRLYSPAMNRHFWTADLNERNHLVNIRGFISEGVGWHQP